MSYKEAQNVEVYRAVRQSGKSLLELYVEVKEERDVAIAQLAVCRIGTFSDPLED
jgi:hypothetical protein